MSTSQLFRLELDLEARNASTIGVANKKSSICSTRGPHQNNKMLFFCVAYSRDKNTKVWPKNYGKGGYNMQRVEGAYY